MEQQDYVAQLGLVCPFCEGVDVHPVDALQSDGAAAWQEIACHSCYKQWTDQYTLTGFNPTNV